MEEYRAYVIGPCGCIINRVDIAALIRKKRDGSRRLPSMAIRSSLWQAERFIEGFMS